MKKGKNAIWTVLSLSLALAGSLLIAQETEIRPVTVGQPMPDFTLPLLHGGDFTLSNLKGKNILLIFPRGLAAEGRWCTIDNYKYAELVDFEKTAQIRQKYQVEVVYVFPYTTDIVQQWLESNPDQLEKIKTWKYPADLEKLDEQGKARLERSKRGFPKDLHMNKGDVPTPFPILIDAERKVSKGLGIFAAEWGGSKVDQCITSVFIVDKNGTLQFKYIGQNTWDRPSYEYLFQTLEQINKSK
ncbi:MAG: redoxin domain-containing protein [Candidatus Aminicenantales bacterium]